MTNERRSHVKSNHSLENSGAFGYTNSRNLCRTQGGRQRKKGKRLQNSNFITITCDRKQVSLDIRTILYIQMHENFAEIHTSGGKSYKTLITLEKLVALMSANPRRIFALEGGVEEGDAADFTVLDLGAEYAVDPGTFLSKGRATPFAGWKVQGRAVLTVVGGREGYRDDGLQL